MTTAHLSPDEVVAALDGDLRGARAKHLASCVSCRDSVDGAAAMVRQVAGADVPEPSPLFWDHLSARVRQATAAEAMRPAGWGLMSWRSWVAVAGAGAAVVLTVMSLPAGKGTPVPSVSGPASSAPAMNTHVSGSTSTSAAGPAVAAAVTPATTAATSGEESTAEPQPWTDVVQLASALSTDDVHGLLPGNEASVLVEDLNASERAAFVRLLRAEMEKSQ